MNKNVINLSDNEGYRSRIVTNHYKGQSEKSIHKHLSFSDGGGGSMNFVSQEQFKEYKDHTSTRFDNVDKVIKTIQEDTSSTKTNVKWILGITATSGAAIIIGFITIIVNII